MVADYISVVDSRSGHYFIVFGINAVIPSHYVTQTKAECVISVHLLYIFSHVVGLFRKVSQFAPFADLRVCYDDDIVICVILVILLQDEVIFLDIFTHFLVEEVFS